MKKDCCNKLSNHSIQNYNNGDVAIICRKCKNIIRELPPLDKEVKDE